MKETDLYNLVKPFLKWKSPNARIYTELEDRDVVVFEDLISDGKTYISEFELKLSLNKELLKQLSDRDYSSRGHYLYAIVPIDKYNQERAMYYLFQKMGWGLITVNTKLAKQFSDYPMRFCEVAVEPTLHHSRNPHNEPMESRLFSHIQNQAGGSVRTLKFTGFKSDLEKVYFALKGLKRPRSWRAILSIMKEQDIRMDTHTIQHRLKCLDVWGVVTVTKRGRTSLYVDNGLGDEIVAEKILKGSKVRVR